MSISAQRHMALKTLVVEHRREWQEMLAQEEVASRRYVIQNLLDRSTGILDRLERGEDVMCQSCGNPIEIDRLRDLFPIRVCGRCVMSRDDKARLKRAVELYRHAKQNRLQLG